jgi:hypothetical protein
MVSLALHSQTASDELLRSMLKGCPQVSSIEINADSLDFTGLGMAEYISSPLERLILKPYQLDYRALLTFLQQEQLNHIGELEIDIEDCS